MNPILLVIIVVAVLLLLSAAWYAYDQRRRSDLRSTFGKEYDRTVEDAGDRRTAESELRERRDRVEALDIRPLPAADRDRYAKEWRDVQARFVDEPRPAIDEADDLIGRVMQDRGYPVADFDQRVADISVGHADVVEHYRAAHAIAERDQQDEGTTDTEELRQAMVHYRALFEDLLGSGDGREEAPPTRTTTTDPELTRRAS
jgi:FtsZ-interacting cell division protein ZipA